MVTYYNNIGIFTYVIFSTHEAYIHTEHMGKFLELALEHNFQALMKFVYDQRPN